MMKRKLKHLTALILAGAIVVCSGGVTARAASYDYWTSRGIKYMAYLKNTIEWNADSEKIKSVDHYQKVSGLLVEKGGITKIKSKSTKKKHVYRCRTTFLAGAEVGGITLGYTTSWDDKITIKNDGSGSVEWD